MILTDHTRMTLKRLFALALALLGCLCIAPAAMLASTVSSYDTSWYSSRPDADSYTITTAEQLAGLAHLVDASAFDGHSVSFEGKTIYLGADIDLSSVCGSASRTSWLPIGYSNTSYASYPFKGTFDGQGHAISNLYVSYDDAHESGDSFAYLPCLGLFGYVKGATLTNFTLTGTVDGSSRGSGSVYYAGGVAGFCESSTFSNIHCLTDVESDRCAGGIFGETYTSYGASSSFTDLVYSGTVKSTNSFYDRAGDAGGIGGFIINANGGTDTMENCVNEGTVSTSSSVAHAGGILGSTSPFYGAYDISGCVNTGTVSAPNAEGSGGIVGLLGGQGGQVTSCYNRGNVKGGSAGGIVGILASDQPSVTHTYSTGKVDGSVNEGGIIGASGEGCVLTSATSACNYSVGTGAGDLYDGILEPLSYFSTTDFLSGINAGIAEDSPLLFGFKADIDTLARLKWQGVDAGTQGSGDEEEDEGAAGMGTDDSGDEDEDGTGSGAGKSGGTDDGTGTASTTGDGTGTASTTGDGTGTASTTDDGKRSSRVTAPEDNPISETQITLTPTDEKSLGASTQSTSSGEDADEAADLEIAGLIQTNSASDPEQASDDRLEPESEESEEEPEPESEELVEVEEVFQKQRLVEVKMPETAIMGFTFADADWRIYLACFGAALLLVSAGFATENGLFLRGRRI